MTIVRILYIIVLAGFCIGLNSATSAPFNQSERFEYRLLATNKTSTMQKEMNEAAQAGFRFKDVMGGETSFGGSEVVVVMWRDPEVNQPGRFQYKLLATSKTSTMQKEMQEAADAGYQYWGQTVFNTAFGGDEVVLIMERDTAVQQQDYRYLLLATKRTGTMQKELSVAGEEGFQLLGLTVGETKFGGKELVSILRKER